MEPKNWIVVVGRIGIMGIRIEDVLGDRRRTRKGKLRLRPTREVKR